MARQDASVRARLAAATPFPDPQLRGRGGVSPITGRSRCNIRLFTVALPEAQPILLPGPFLSATLHHLAEKGLVRWENFYDPDDVLGWPLEHLYDPRKDGRPGPIISDHVVNVGGPLSSWNPKSHGEYWGDREFAGPVADHLHSIVEQL